jgi:8-oxo-dGTP pyrophosphatase MutT (NUDIX family)
MFCTSRAAVAVAEPEKYRSYIGAGLVITNGALILCGYEPHKRKPAIYGIGGKRESTDTTYRETAFREAMEELLGLTAIPPRTLQTMMSRKPCYIEDGHGYIMLQYSFADLDWFLGRLRGLRSPFYDRMPRTIAELLLNRRVEASTEMTHLCMVPVVSPTPAISRDLSSDIDRIFVRVRKPEFVRPE